MFDTYMTDQRVPIGVAFMLFACGDLELRRRLVRRGFMIVLIVLIAGRLIEIDYNWSQLSDSTSQMRSSVKRIKPGSKVFVAYADRSRRRRRARSRAGACRLHRHHRTLLVGHHVVHGAAASRFCT